MIKQVKILGLMLGLALGLGFGLVGSSLAQNADVGYNATTGLQGYNGLDVALGVSPVMTGCNTSAPSYKGGAGAGQITTVGTTACTPTLTWVIPKLGVGATNNPGGYGQAVFAPTLTGVQCWLVDMTTTTKLFTQSATAYTAPTATAAGLVSCTFTASAAIVSGDVLIFSAVAF